jgi:hypothetical protein
MNNEFPFCGECEVDVIPTVADEVFPAGGVGAGSLKPDATNQPSKDSLPGGWPTFRDGVRTHLIIRPCPAARVLCPITCRGHTDPIP